MVSSLLGGILEISIKILNAFDLAIFLPGTHLIVIVAQLHKDTRVFFAALFVTAKD